MGTLSPYPWDLPLWRQNGWFVRGGWRRPAIPAPGSALGSHPCVALSHAQVLTIYAGLLRSHRKSLLERASAEYNNSCSGSVPLAGFEVSLYGRF